MTQTNPFLDRCITNCGFCTYCEFLPEQIQRLCYFIDMSMNFLNYMRSTRCRNINGFEVKSISTFMQKSNKFTKEDFKEVIPVPFLFRKFFFVYVSIAYCQVSRIICRVFLLIALPCVGEAS